jgi:hypothetical protein
MNLPLSRSSPLPIDEWIGMYYALNVGIIK